MYNRTPFLGLVLAGLVSACGGSSTAPTDTAPTASAPGVTLSGTFGGGQGSTLRSLGTTTDDLVVVVLDASGTELARVDVVGGRFTLRGLPTGSFEVQFLDGTDVVGQETFDAVKVNQQITVTLELTNGSVRIVEERRNGIPHGDIEIEGRIDRLEIEGDPMTGALEVDGYSIVTRIAETAIRKGGRALTLEDLREGDQVHVKGEYETAADGSLQVFAREIKLQDEIDRDDVPTTCNVFDPAKPGKILICHKGKTLSVGADAWSGHAGHGDTCGPCS